LRFDPISEVPLKYPPKVVYPRLGFAPAYRL